MKKIMAMLVMLMLIALPIATAHPEDEQNEQTNEGKAEMQAKSSMQAKSEAEVEESENQTEHEIEAMTTSHGAKMRLLQLENSITRNIRHGEKVIEEIKKTNTSFNTTDMETILEELKALRVQVQQVAPENGDEAAQQFVALKHDAIDLTHKFRDEARKALGARIETMRQKVKSIENDEMKELHEKIRKEMREYNAERMGKFLTSVGKANETLTERILSGEATIGEIRATFNQEIKSISKEKRKEAVAILKEDLSKMKIARQAAMQKAKMNYTERRAERIESRLQKMQNEKMRARARAIAKVDATEKTEAKAK